MNSTKHTNLKTNSLKRKYKWVTNIDNLKSYQENANESNRIILSILARSKNTDHSITGKGVKVNW